MEQQGSKGLKLARGTDTAVPTRRQRREHKCAPPSTSRVCGQTQGGHAGPNSTYTHAQTTGTALECGGVSRGQGGPRKLAVVRSFAAVCNPLCFFQEPPREHLAPLRKEREAAKAEEQQQSEELLKQTETERQKIVWEWQELRGFLEEQEQQLLSRLEELERVIVQRRDEGICSLSWEISLLSERGGEKGQQPLSQPLQGAGSTGGSREDETFRKPEPSFAELEKRLGDFSLKSAMLQEVLLGFKAQLSESPFPMEQPCGAGSVCSGCVIGL
nr:zinc finger protein RFP-like [Chelonoidis abingdonii]